MYHKKAGIILNRIMLRTACIVVAYYIFGPFKDLIVTHPLKCVRHTSLSKQKCFENRAFVALLHLDIILSNTVLLFTNTKVWLSPLVFLRQLQRNKPLFKARLWAVKLYLSFLMFLSLKSIVCLRPKSGTLRSSSSELCY